LIDVRSVKLAPAPAPAPAADAPAADAAPAAPATDVLEAEVVVARYLVLAPVEDPEGGAGDASGGKSGGAKKPARTKAPAGKQP
jgi:hypothetical protein